MQTQATTMPLGSMPVPMPTGSLEAYVQTVNRFPILSAEEERALAQRFRAEGDLEAARSLVLSHLRLVVAVARGYLGYGLPHADLIQEGNIGLMKAVKRFDPERGVRLVSFAIHWIKAEIHEYSYAPAQYLADHESEPYRVLEAEESARVQAAGLQKALASLDPRSRRIIEARWLKEKDGATLHELAAEFNVSAERIRQIETKALEKMRKAIGNPDALRALPAPASA